jgi:hypothetical protein
MNGMQKYAPWIIVCAALALAVFTYFENRRLLRTLEQTARNAPALVPSPAAATGAPGSLETTSGAGAVGTLASPAAPAASPLAHPTGRMLQGLCVDPERKPVPGAAVVAVVLKAGVPDREFRNTVSDSNGRFGVPYAPGEQLETLRAEREGFAPAEVGAQDLATTRFVELLLQPLASCEVQLFRTMPNGALDRFSGKATFYVMRRTPTRAETEASEAPREATAVPGRFVTIGAEEVEVRDGHYLLQGYPEGVYKIAVVAQDDYAESEPFKLDRTGQVVATVVLGTRQHFGGRVLSKRDQSPVAGARVTMLPQKLPNARFAAQLQAATVTDRDGHFAFDKLVPTVYTLTIAADGFTTQVVDEVTVPAGAEPPREETYYLTPGAPEVRVSVVGPDGQPAQGAKVAAYNSDTPSPLPTHFAETDRQGSAVLRGLVPGRYMLIVTLPGGENRQKYRELIVEESNAQDVQIVFDPMVQVRGTARQSGGDVFTGLIYFVPRGSVGPKSFAKCDLQGMFRVELEPGDYVVGRGDQPPVTQVKVLALDNQNLTITLP